MFAAGLGPAPVTACRACRLRRQDKASWRSQTLVAIPDEERDERFPTASKVGAALFVCDECALIWRKRGDFWGEWDEDFEADDEAAAEAIRRADGALECSAFEHPEDDGEPIEVGDGIILFKGTFTGAPGELDLTAAEAERLMQAEIAMDGKPPYLDPGQIVMVWLGPGLAVAWQLVGEWSPAAPRHYVLLRRDDLHVGIQWPEEDKVPDKQPGKTTRRRAKR